MCKEEGELRKDAAFFSTVCPHEIPWLTIRSKAEHTLLSAEIPHFFIQIGNLLDKSIIPPDNQAVFLSHNGDNRLPPAFLAGKFASIPLENRWRELHYGECFFALSSTIPPTKNKEHIP